MANQNDSEKSKHRKPYQKPTVTSMNPEEAKLKLLDLAKQGDEEAREMLEMIFPAEAEKLKRKKSA